MDLPFPIEDLSRLYRFALLLTGDEAVAQPVLYETCLECAARMGSYRNDASRFACMLAVVREKVKSGRFKVEGAAEPRGVSPAGAGPVVRAFATLPEEERTALAALYSGLLPAREIGEVLKMPLERLGAVLKSARERLRRSGLALDEPTLEPAL